MTEELHVCNPCRSDHHMECASSPQMSCQCLVCAGERIGDEVMGDAGGNVPRHGQITDRYDPRPWRPGD